MELSLSELREILRVFVDSDMRDLDLEVGEVRLQVSKDSRQGPPQPVAPEPPRRAVAATTPPALDEAAAARDAPAAAPSPGEDRPGLLPVRSPVVGVFYRRPAPDQPPYVEVGDVVTPESPICTIEVMKMFTAVPAGTAGIIAEICVDNLQLVEHGQVLMYIRPAAE
jgi:acetyl-CoA carboxylase biotin carboxyl carrier protein